MANLIPFIPAGAYRAVQVGNTTYWRFSLVVRIASLGRVWLAIGYATADLTGSHAILISNQVAWSRHQIIAAYLQRRPTETLYHLNLAPINGNALEAEAHLQTPRQTRTSSAR